MSLARASIGWTFGRVTVRVLPRIRATWCIDRFPEGTVYRAWLLWLFVKVRIPVSR